MAKLSEKDVLHVAKLARLDIGDKELPILQNQLSEVVDFVGQLSEVNTDDVEPTSQTTGLENVLRIDEVAPKNCLSQEEALSGTDKTYNGYFVVGRVIKK